MSPNLFDDGTVQRNTVEKDDAHYIGMSLFFLGLPFVIYGFIHLFI